MYIHRIIIHVSSGCELMRKLLIHRRLLIVMYTSPPPATSLQFCPLRSYMPFSADAIVPASCHSILSTRPSCPYPDTADCTIKVTVDIHVFDAWINPPPTARRRCGVCNDVLAFESKCHDKSYHLPEWRVLGVKCITFSLLARGKISCWASAS